MVAIMIEIIILSGIIFIIKKMREMETKENIKKMREMETKENINKMKEMRDFSEIENKCNSLVEIKEVQIENYCVDNVYLLKVAGIDIRLFIGIVDANRNLTFMKSIVREVIKNGCAKVEVKELKTDEKTYFLLHIDGKNVKIYTTIGEAQRVANYMSNVIDAILKMI